MDEDLFNDVELDVEMDDEIPTFEHPEESNEEEEAQDLLFIAKDASPGKKQVKFSPEQVGN